MTAALLCVCLAYANSLRNGFHFDDFHTVTDNPSIRSLRNIPRFFTDATTFSVLPPNRTYRPFVSTSLAIDYALGHGYVPLWFHLGTLLVFLLQLVTMFYLFRRILGLEGAELQPSRDTPATKRALASEGAGVSGAPFIAESQPAMSGKATIPTCAALFAATWYGLHPAIAETVNYIIQRGDIYSTLGVVGSLALFACKPNLRRTGLYLLPFLFGILSKPPAIVLPALLFAYVALFDPDPATARTPWKKAAVLTLPSLLTGVAAMVLQSAMTPKTFTPTTTSRAAYCLTQPFVLLRYFCSFFAPIHLNVDTDLAPFHSFTPGALAGILFLIALIAAISLTARRRTLRPIAYGLLWFLIASIPTSVYTLSEVENDHRMYMPFVGLVLAVTWTLSLLAQRYGSFFANKYLRPAIATLGIVLLAAYGYGTHVRNQVWRTDETLWLDDIQKSPHNGRGLMNYGLTQMAKGDYASALDAFTRAQQYTPNYATLEINLGVVYGELHLPVQAEPHFQRAILLSPGDDQPHFFYGRWLVLAGRLHDARSQLSEAVRMNPLRIPPRDLLAQVLARTGDTAAALTLARATLALAPDDATARTILAHPPTPDLHATADGWINTSLAKYQQQDFPGAIAAARQALQLDPRSALAWNNIAAGEASLGHWDAAIAAADQALRLQPDFQLAKNNRAWAERERGAQH